jgi:AcrR family transcriptional regulator
MARTVGARNADYDDERMALARRVRPTVLGPDGLRSSMREMAAVGKTSVATLKHYFHDREGVIRAVMEAIRFDASPYLAVVGSPIEHDVRRSLLTMLQGLNEAWFRHGVGRMHSVSLAAGLSTTPLGPSYVNYLLEPMLESGESRIRRHIERGELRVCNIRYAALHLLSPVVMVLLHQDSLGGAACRPLDANDFLVHHVDAFLRAYPPTAKGQARPRLSKGRGEVGARADASR